MRIHGKLSNKNGWKASKMEIKYKNVKMSKNNNDKLLFKKKKTHFVVLKVVCILIAPWAIHQNTWEGASLRR